MQLPSGLFCFELARGSTEPGGRSIRYSLMTEIGLRRAAAAGVEHPFDLDRIRSAALEEVGSGELQPGDYGLYLWADALAPRNERDQLVGRLRSAVDAAGGLAVLEGMEVAWIVQGLVLGGGDDELLRAALDLLLGENQAPSGLFYHYGPGPRRRRFPNFATQIYGVLALSTAAREGLDERAHTGARRAADRLLELQLADGGWPWLYDADRGSVVEPYEVFSVHQHGMAPMALLELAEVSGDGRYAAAAHHGLAWLHGRNDLGIEMADAGAVMIYRSIRRRPPWNRIAVAANLACSAAGLRAPFRAGRRLELNAVCRPYELGWLVEAWAGRDELLR
ncbi:MAG TPA: hypothetical protein VFT76_04560 [Actinomycetota bacterium]|nr:hypothetical protein [Actinomycetota bacterium]